MASEAIVETCQTGGSIADFTRLEHAIVGTAYMFCGVVGVVTNLLLIWTLVKDRRVLGETTRWLHISLALANTAVVAPCPFPASSSFSGKWLYGDWLCQAYAFEGMFVGLAAIGAVVSLCLERYVNTSRTEAMQQNSLAFYWVTTAISLTNAFFWALMPILGWSRYRVEHSGISCAIDWKYADEGYTSYMSMLTVFSFALPILVAIVALYKSVPNTTAAPSGRPSSSSCQQSGTACEPDTVTSTSNECQLRWLCLTLLVLMVVGWSPFAAICLWAIVGNTAGVSMLAASLPPLICKFSTILYPLAYNVICPRLRASYLATIGLGSQQTAAKAD